MHGLPVLLRCAGRPVILLGEGATPLRLAGIGLIVAGIVALKLA